MPSDVTSETSIQLMLDLIVARIPLTAGGTVGSEGLSELSGLARIERSLEQLIGALPTGFDGRTLNQLTGDALSGIVLDSLEFQYRKPFARITVTAKVGGSRVRFVFFKDVRKGQAGFVTGLELLLDESALSGNVLTDLVGKLRLTNLGIYYANEELRGVAYDPGLEPQDARRLNLGIPPTKLRDFQKGINWTSKLSVGKLEILDFPPAAEAKKPAAGDQPRTTEPERPNSGKPSDSTLWIDIDKTFGPLSVRRIGLGYEAPRVAVKFDAGLQLNVLTLTLEGFALSYPLDKFSDLSVRTVLANLQLSLDGMGLSIGSGPVEIGGSLLRVRNSGRLEFEGALLVRTAAFSLSAIGSYADLNGVPSVMAYAVLLKELGGPAFFFVTGLAFGFGINRRLRLPTITELPQFALVKAAMGVEGFSDLARLPGELRDYVSPLAGNYWIAAGIKFTSFAIIESFALLTVSFGAEVEIGLLGLSRLTMPAKVKAPIEPVASAELALRAVVRLSEGLIQVEARLTENSYIFSRACRLTGGFAFCAWFSGPRAGDFVVTLGGYHPAFVRPAHYPVVPRVGIHWQIGSEISVTGEAYFALTPSCLMAGGRLCAVFRAGAIEAWFTAYANFLLCWQPFYYMAEMGISIGVACRVDVGLFTISIRVELSVGLELWGPPFGGVVLVSLSVISFEIRFGSGRTLPPPLKPVDFIAQCLPPSKVEGEPEVFSVRVANGLLREQTVDQGNTTRIVNAQQLSLIAQSVIPTTAFGGLASDVRPGAAASLGIRPSGETSLESVFDVKVGRRGLRGAKRDQRPKFVVSAVNGNVPDALWGKAPEQGKTPLPATPEAKTLEATVGVRIACSEHEPEHSLPPIAIEKLKYTIINVGPVNWIDPKEAPDQSYPSDTTIFNTVLDDKRRAAILTSLKSQSPFPLNTPDLQELAKSSRTYFQAGPQYHPLGSRYE